MVPSECYCNCILILVAANIPRVQQTIINSLVALAVAVKYYGQALIAAEEQQQQQQQYQGEETPNKERRDYSEARTPAGQVWVLKDLELISQAPKHSQLSLDIMSFVRECTQLSAYIKGSNVERAKLIQHLISILSNVKKLLANETFVKSASDPTTLRTFADVIGKMKQIEAQQTIDANTLLSVQDCLARLASAVKAITLVLHESESKSGESGIPSQTSSQGITAGSFSLNGPIPAAPGPSKPDTNPAPSQSTPPPSKSQTPGPNHALPPIGNMDANSTHEPLNYQHDMSNMAGTIFFDDDTTASIQPSTSTTKRPVVAGTIFFDDDDQLAAPAFSNSQAQAQQGPRRPAYPGTIFYEMDETANNAPSQQPLVRKVPVVAGSRISGSQDASAAPRFDSSPMQQRIVPPAGENSMQRMAGAPSRVSVRMSSDRNLLAEEQNKVENAMGRLSYNAHAGPNYGGPLQIVDAAGSTLNMNRASLPTDSNRSSQQQSQVENMTVLSIAPSQTVDARGKYIMTLEVYLLRSRISSIKTRKIMKTDVDVRQLLQQLDIQAPGYLPRMTDVSQVPRQSEQEMGIVRRETAILLDAINRQGMLIRSEVVDRFVHLQDEPIPEAVSSMVRPWLCIYLIT